MYKDKLEEPIRKKKKAIGLTPKRDVGAEDLKEEIDKVLRIQEKRIVKYQVGANN